MSDIEQMYAINQANNIKSIIEASCPNIGNPSSRIELDKYLLQNPINAVTLLFVLCDFVGAVYSLRGKGMVETKKAKDPKHMALTEIEAQYQLVRTQFKRRGYSAQFIRNMANKYPIIESQKTIENLVSKLNKKNDDIPR